MSPTSYQAAPPRVIDTTRLAALLQPHPIQVPDKCPEFEHADVQIAPCAQPRRVRKCPEWLKGCRAPEAWTPQSLAPQPKATASASISRMRFEVLLRRSARCIIS